MRIALFLTLLLHGCSHPYAVADGDAGTASHHLPTDAGMPSDDGSMGATNGDPLGWRDQVVYLALPDRFFNGSRANDQLGPADCFAPNDPQKFHGGDLIGLAQKVSYLTELGITTLRTTPLYLQTSGPPGLCGYHGGWPDFTTPDDGALDPRLGTESELHGLLGGLQKSGIRFILDLVVNHAGDGARLFMQEPDWFHDPKTCSMLGPPLVYCPERPGLHDFAQEKPTVADYLDGVSRGWLSRFPLDGVSVSSADEVLPAYLHDRLLPLARATRPPLFLIADVFSDSSVTNLRPTLELGFDAAFNFPLQRALVDSFGKGGTVDEIANALLDALALLGNEQSLRMINLLDNHQLPRFTNEPGLGVPEDEIYRRYQLALCALFTLPGIPQLYAGDELGLYGGADPDNRRDMPSWSWTAADRKAATSQDALPNPDATFSYVQELIRLRHDNPALRTGSFVELWRQNGESNPNVFAFFRGAADNRLVVLFNNSASPSGTLAIPIQGNGALPQLDRAALDDGVVLVDLLGLTAPAALTVSGGVLHVNLTNKQAGVYRPSAAADGCAVTFRVRAPKAEDAVALVGDAPELGSWDPAQSIAMTSSSCDGTSCSWTVTLRYLAKAKPIAFKFVNKSGSNSTWEGGSNRTLSVPTASTTVYDGADWQP